MISEFHIDIGEAELAALRRRLVDVRWPDRLDGARWEFGTDLEFLQELHAYWLEAYDWRREEQRLNSLSHHKFLRNGSSVHFIHQVGKGLNPLPLIMTHGWPGSFVEMQKIIPLLTDPGAHGGDPADAFSLVVPSIPGHGFSDRPTKPGTNVFAVADIWADLMTALGYDRFGAQGGDWGSWISSALGLRHADRLIGLHLNYVSTGFRPDLNPGTPPLAEEEVAYLDRVAKWREAEGAYIAIQGTKPQTLAYGLTDSPIGLAAWLIEKFQGWSDSKQRPDETLTQDELLTNVMIHWLTNTVHSSFRFYSEARACPLHLQPGQRILPPCGIVRLPRELPMPPRRWVERAFNLTHWTTLPRGGHFAAMEAPELLAEDIRAFFRPLRAAAGNRFS
ncbi:MAG TPA: epoxide hydrolase [Aliidongia sp.]|uniref:epoxide hydrolase family protein n=1 Tax=Aliidongia sp. TaxID=1914230 RepID=UPI002DDCE526|nr:epoxide hydrolase [Aliidongia sp.]HEV2673108.1 epoxide hydrolase [Aliidongia sp.]